MSKRLPKWLTPAFTFALGLACLVAFWLGDNLREGIYAFASLAVVGVLFAVGGRSETVRGLRGDGRDEYWSALDRDATLLAGLVVICVLIAMCLWEWGHGRDGSPYSQVAAIGGIAYIVAYAGLRLRR